MSCLPLPGLCWEWNRTGPCQPWDSAAAPGAPELHQQMVPGTGALRHESQGEVGLVPGRGVLGTAVFAGH